MLWDVNDNMTLLRLSLAYIGVSMVLYDAIQDWLPNTESTININQVIILLLLVLHITGSTKT